MTRSIIDPRIGSRGGGTGVKYMPMKLGAEGTWLTILAIFGRVSSCNIGRAFLGMFR